MVADLEEELGSLGGNEVWATVGQAVFVVEVGTEVVGVERLPPREYFPDDFLHYYFY